MRYTFFCVNYCSLSLLFVGVLSQEKININFDAGQNALEDVTTDKDLSKAGTTEKPSAASSVISKTDNTVAISLRTKETASEKPQALVCPGKEVRIPIFSLPCTVTKECAFLGRSMLCCNRRCLRGVQPPKPEPKHAPTFFGFVERICPIVPIAEIWEIKECQSDDDCGMSRICCPETLRNGNTVSYCRTAQPLWDKLPAARRFVQPVRNLVSYMQCTPPPPPYLDLFPKSCQSPLDCFPNLCCQEGGKKFCRPPRKSFLSLVAAIAQRLIPTGAARSFLQRITV